MHTPTRKELTAKRRNDKRDYKLILTLTFLLATVIQYTIIYLGVTL